MKKLFFFSTLGVILSFAACTTDNSISQDDCTFFTNATQPTIHLKNDPNKNVDYYITCLVNVSKDIIIDPGTVIHFADNAGINIPEGGSLKAVGTSLEPIIFSSPAKQKGSWRGIRFESSNIKNQLEYVTIEYAGEGNFDSNSDKGGIIVSHHGRLDIKNSIIQHNTHFGINILSENGEIESNTFTNNDYPIKIVQNSFRVIKENNQFVNNIKNHIWVDLKAESISSDVDVINPSIPYYFKHNGGSLFISANFKILPGVTIIMSPGAHIIVSGSSASFNAVGTITNPIIIKGEIEQAGGWKNIYFQHTTNALNKIAYAKIMHAGEDMSQTKGAIELWADPAITLENIEFSDIQGCEVKSHVENPLNLTYTNLTNNANSVTPCY